MKYYYALMSSCLDYLTQHYGEAYIDDALLQEIDLITLLNPWRINSDEVELNETELQTKELIKQEKERVKLSYY